MAEGSFRHVLAGHVSFGCDVTTTLHGTVIRVGPEQIHNRYMSVRALASLSMLR
jgi:hypothetical protein